MIKFPLYKITCNNDEILTEDPDIVRELVIQLLTDNDEITIRKELNE